jgi:hypothetical protein
MPMYWPIPSGGAEVCAPRTGRAERTVGGLGGIGRAGRGGLGEGFAGGSFIGGAGFGFRAASGAEFSPSGRGLPQFSHYIDVPPVYFSFGFRAAFNAEPGILRQWSAAFGTMPGAGGPAEPRRGLQAYFPAGAASYPGGQGAGLNGRFNAAAAESASPERTARQARSWALTPSERTQRNRRRPFGKEEAPRLCRLGD